MPTYEYRCDHCDRNFDVVQSFHDDPLTRCPTCDSPVRKVFGNVGIVFKGTGFYKTDSRDGAKAKNTSRGEGAGVKDGASTSGDKTDKGSASDSSSAGDGAKSGEKKGSSSSDAGNGKSPAPATSSPS